MKPNRCHLGTLIVVVFVPGLGQGLVIALDSEGAGESNPAADWFVGTVDDTRVVGYDVSVATDSISGETFVSYYEGINGDLWLARNDPPRGTGNCGPGNTWNCQVLDIPGVVGKYNSIAVGGAGPVASLFISYCDVTNGSLKVYEGTVDRQTGALVGESYVVEAGIPGSSVFFGRQTAVAVSDEGVPHIAYREDRDTWTPSWYAKHTTRVDPGTGNCGEGAAENNWQCTTFFYQYYYNDGFIDFFDIDVGSSGTPFIVFRSGYSYLRQPTVATPVAVGGNCNYSDQWNCIDVNLDGSVDAGGYLSIVIAGDHTPHLAFRDATNQTLQWSRYVGIGGNCGPPPGRTGWQCETIDDIGDDARASGVAIEIDGAGYPVIAYQDVDSGFFDLKIARPLGALSWVTSGNCGPLSPTFFPSWRCDTLDAGDQWYAQAVGGLSISTSATGEAAIAYRSLDLGSNEGLLKVAMEPRLVFRDGFESGDTTRWSTTVN